MALILRQKHKLGFSCTLKYIPGTTYRSLVFCHIHAVTFTLISNFAADIIQKRREEPCLFSFEYNLTPKLVSK